MRDISNDEAMAQVFRNDPAYAVELLNDILKDGDQGEVLIALRVMAKALGGVQSVAEKAQLNPTQLYRTLSAEGNPELNTLLAVVRALGLRLAVERVRAA
jgi:probable addiction module antidote protein